MITNKDIEVVRNVWDGDLRDYQLENKRKIYDAWLGCQSVMLQMPTGTGKTRLFCSLMRDICDAGKEKGISFRILVLAHRTELLKQIQNEINKYGMECGCIQAKVDESPELPIQVASVQTLKRRLERWGSLEVDFIIVDEAHHIVAKSYQEILEAFPEAKLLGVTATPYRLSGEGFTDTFDKLILSDPIDKFIERHYLSSVVYYSVKGYSDIVTQVNNIEALGPDGDYDESELMKVCDKASIRSQIVASYLEKARGKRGFVYTINTEHNEHVCQDFLNAGISAAAISYKTPEDIRSKVIEEFHNGEIDVLCNVNLFSEGVDCPGAEFIQLARPTKSLAMYLQQVGRGLRPLNGKEHCIVIDNVALYASFGLPDSHFNWKKYFIGHKKGTPKHIERSGVTSPRYVNTTEGHETITLINGEITENEAERCEKYEKFLLGIRNHMLNKINDVAYYITSHETLESAYGYNNLFCPYVHPTKEERDDLSKKKYSYSYSFKINRLREFDYKGRNQNCDYLFFNKDLQIVNSLTWGELHGFINYVEEQYGSSLGTYAGRFYLENKPHKRYWNKFDFLKLIVSCEFFALYDFYNRFDVIGQINDVGTSFKEYIQEIDIEITEKLHHGIEDMLVSTLFIENFYVKVLREKGLAFIDSLIEKGQIIANENSANLEDIKKEVELYIASGNESYKDSFSEWYSGILYLHMHYLHDYPGSTLPKELRKAPLKDILKGCGILDKDYRIPQSIMSLYYGEMSLSPELALQVRTLSPYIIKNKICDKISQKGLECQLREVYGRDFSEEYGTDEDYFIE